MFKRINLLFLIPAVIHYIFTFTAYKSDIRFNSSYEITYLIIKIITFALIILLWQLIPYFIKQIKEDNKTVKFFLLFSSIYFIINMILYAFVYPGYVYDEAVRSLESMCYSSLDTFWHWLTSFYLLCLYYTIPSAAGMFMLNIAIESAIAGWVILQIKNKVSSRFFLLFFIPLFLPYVLIFNMFLSRYVYTAYLALFVFVYIFANTKCAEKSGKKAVILGAAAALLTSWRSENISLLITLPIMVYFLKVFNCKKFIVFLLVFLSGFTCIYGIQRHSAPYRYELHNLVFVYNKLVEEGADNLKTAECREILKKVFLEFNGNKINQDVLNLENDDNSRRALKCLMELLIRNRDYFIQENINLYINEAPLIGDVMPYSEMRETTRNIFKPLYKNFRNEVFAFTADFHKKPLKTIIHNPLVNFSVMIFLFLYGIIFRKPFYIFWTLCWICILYSILLTIPWNNYMYLYAFMHNTCMSAFIFLISLMEEIFCFVQHKCRNFKQNRQ